MTTGMPKKLPWEDWREGDDLYTSGWMRATSPSGSAAYEGQVQWSGDLGYGVRSPEGGQSGKRDDATTGSKPLRETLERHLSPADQPAAKRGPRGAIGRMIEKAERFSPSASRKHKAKADADYAEALSAGDSDRGKTARAVSDSLAAPSADPAQSAHSAPSADPAHNEPTEDVAPTDSTEADGGSR